MYKALSFAWLALGIGIAVTSFMDIGDAHWRISWLALGVVAAVMAWACSLILYFDRAGKIAGIVIAAVFILYCVYLFLLSVPVPLNLYSFLGGAVIVLGLSTIVALARRKGSSSGQAANEF